MEYLHRDRIRSVQEVSKKIRNTLTNWLLYREIDSMVKEREIDC